MTPKDPYLHLLVKDYTHWNVYLHENQCYLGRMYLWLKRDDVVDLFALRKEEQDELFAIGKELQNALGSLFKPDLYNYAALSNVSAHLHIHFIPRYKEAKTFAGQEFIDERWGKNYAPYNYEYVVSERVLFKIRDALRKELTV